MLVEVLPRRLKDSQNKYLQLTTLKSVIVAKASLMQSNYITVIKRFSKPISRHSKMNGNGGQQFNAAQG